MKIAEKLPYAHLAIIDASRLSPYALESLAKGSASSWDSCLAKLKQLSYNPIVEMPFVCLLPPKQAKLHPQVAAALAPEKLKEHGLHAIYLESETESALLEASKKAVEMFYADAFRPDPILESLEEYRRQAAASQAEAANRAENPFREELALPLSMRYTNVDSRQALRAENLSSRQVHCYWLDGAAPDFSLELSEKLYRQHHRFVAELSFSDMYPQGLVPVLFQAAILGRLWHLRQKDSKPDGILKIAERDLNLFAVELLLGEKDYRQLRLDLRAGSKRQLLALKNLHAAVGPSASVAEILQWTETSNLRTLPRYFPVQISALCPQTCSYCPYPQIAPQTSAQQEGPTFMSRELWRHLLAAIVDFVDDAVINLSPLGEALMHPEFVGFVEDLLAHPSLELVIETSGAHDWAAEDIRSLLQWNQRDPRITWILSLDALDTELYRKLRPAQVNAAQGQQTQQEKAWALAELLLYSPESLPRQVYLQAVRMKDNEKDLENFYRYWVEGKSSQTKRDPKEGTKEGLKEDPPRHKLDPSQIIIQKYNSYAGFLPERQLVRLDPVERFPCRRLEREMVFDLHGQAFVCVQDLQRELVPFLGRFPECGLEELWQAGQKVYQQHVERSYSSLCQGCDEYYVYNF